MLKWTKYRQMNQPGWFIEGHQCFSNLNLSVDIHEILLNVTDCCQNWPNTCRQHEKHHQSCSPTHIFPVSWSISYMVTTNNVDTASHMHLCPHIGWLSKNTHQECECDYVSDWMTTADSPNEHHFCCCFVEKSLKFQIHRCRDLIFLILTAGDSLHRCISPSWQSNSLVAQ